MARPQDLLVVEMSQLHEGRWRFGRHDEPHSAWGLIERNEIGGVVITRRQADRQPWRDDGVTALCLVASRPNEHRIEYDLSWKPVDSPLYRERNVTRKVLPTRGESLGERAKRFRGTSE